MMQSEEKINQFIAALLFFLFFLSFSRNFPLGFCSATENHTHINTHTHGESEKSVWLILTMN